MRRLAPLLGALVLAACGSSPSQERLGEAADAMEAQDSARFAFTATMESRDLADRPIPFSGEGVSTLSEREVGRLTMDMARMFEIIISEEVTDPDERAFVEELFGDRAGWIAETRFFGDVGYMRIPALTELLGSKPWVKLDEDTEGESGLDVAFGSSVSPADFLRQLRAAGDVEEVGSETVGGRETTHFRGAVDLERVAEQDPDLRERIERAIEQTGQRTVPIDVWIDAEGLVRRIKFTDVSPPGKDEKYPTTFRLTMDLPEYGVEVDVERPPGAQVISEAEFDRLTES